MSIQRLYPQSIKISRQLKKSSHWTYTECRIKGAEIIHYVRELMKTEELK